MKIIKKLSLIASVASMALAAQLNALTIAGAIGSIDPSTPANALNEVGGINALIALPADLTAPIIGDNNGTYDGGTSSAVLDRFSTTEVGPGATSVGGLQGQAPSGSVNVDGWDYLAAKYGTALYVWYVGGLSGFQDVPLFELPGQGENAQSHYSLYNPGTTVPDGGTTVALLGFVLGALAVVRRKFRS